MPFELPVGSRSAVRTSIAARPHLGGSQAGAGGVGKDGGGDDKDGGAGGDDGGGEGSPPDQRELQGALTHLDAARESVPDSTLFAACHAQLLSYCGDLTKAFERLRACAQAGMPSSCAEELCLLWLQRHRPQENGAIRAAAIRLLQIDPAAEAALPILEEMVEDVPNPGGAQRSGSDLSAPSSREVHRAHEAVGGRPTWAPPFALQGGEEMSSPRWAHLLWLTASLVEIRAHEPRAWRLLHKVLRRSDAVSDDLRQWWQGCTDWWPDFPLQVWQTSYGEDVPPVAFQRALCARAIVEGLRKAPACALVAQSMEALFQPLLELSSLPTSSRSDIPRYGPSRPQSDGWQYEAESGAGPGIRQNGQAMLRQARKRRADHAGPARRAPAKRKPFNSRNSIEEADNDNPEGCSQETGCAGFPEPNLSQASQEMSSQQSFTAWI